MVSSVFALNEKGLAPMPNTMTYRFPTRHPYIIQETEEALEELRSKYRDTRLRMDAEVESLAGQVNALTHTIEVVQVWVGCAQPWSHGMH